MLIRDEARILVREVRQGVHRAREAKYGKRWFWAQHS